MLKFMKLNVCLLFFIMLTACGFHLQGKKPLAAPLHRLYLQSPDPYGPLARNLQQSLRMSNVQLVDSPVEAETILDIIQDSDTQTLLAPNGTLQTRQYNLTVTVTFQVLDPKGRILIGPQTLSETRPITIQSNQVLGSSNEVTSYYQQMRRTLAYAIMNRLASQEMTHLLLNASRTSASKP